MTSKFRRATTARVVLLAGLCAGSAVASVPQVLTEQGLLIDPSGVPVVGSVQVIFTIYDAATSGNVLWQETQTITLDSGFFSALLGETTAFPANMFNGQVL